MVFTQAFLADPCSFLAFLAKKASTAWRSWAVYLKRIWLSRIWVKICCDRASCGSFKPFSNWTWLIPLISSNAENELPTPVIVKGNRHQYPVAETCCTVLQDLSNAILEKLIFTKCVGEKRSSLSRFNPARDNASEQSWWNWIKCTA